MRCYPLVVAACLLAASWVVFGDVRRLKTRESDGVPVCAQDEPSRRATKSTTMSRAPAVVACGMTCTSDHQCRHFNYVSTDSLHPCHLYYYRPTQFHVQPNCLHYHVPGKLCTVVVKPGLQNWGLKTQVFVFFIFRFLETYKPQKSNLGFFGFLGFYCVI